MERRFTAFVCVLLLQACATQSQVVSIEQVRSSEFDGDWTAVMKNTAPSQSWSDVRFDCDDFTEPFFLRVRRGIVSGYLQTDENYSFRTSVDSAGEFTGFIPIDSFYRYRKGIAIEKSNIALLLSGRLAADQRKGQFVIADTRMDFNGCSTDVEFTLL